MTRAHPAMEGLTDQPGDRNVKGLLFTVDTGPKNRGTLNLMALRRPEGVMGSPKGACLWGGQSFLSISVVLRVKKQNFLFSAMYPRLAGSLVSGESPVCASWDYRCKPPHLSSCRNWASGLGPPSCAAIALPTDCSFLPCPLPVPALHIQN